MLELLDSRVLSDIQIKDHDTGRMLPPWFLLPQAVIALSDSTNTRRFLHEVVAMENELQEFETAGLFFPKMFYTEAAPRGKAFIGYKQKIRQGQAKLLSRSANKFPRTDSQIKAHLAPIAPIGLSYEINYFDREEAEVLGQDLDREGMYDTREGIMEGIDKVFHFGGATPDGEIVKGVLEFLNGGGADEITDGTTFYKITLTTGDSGNTWALKTGKEIFEEIGGAMAYGFKKTMGKRMYNKMAIGFNANDSFMTKTLIDEDNGINTTMTVDQAVKKKYPDLQVIVNPNLDNINLVALGLSLQETWNGGSDDNAVLFWNDSKSNYRLIVDAINVLRPYEHSGFTTVTNAFGLVSSFMPKKLTDFAYIKGV